MNLVRLVQFNFYQMIWNIVTFCIAEKHARVTVHPLHVHRLFYTQLYDTTQTIYALKTVMSILEVDGKAFVFASATTSMNMCNTAHQTALRELLIRHRRALSGKDFYGSLTDSE